MKVKELTVEQLLALIQEAVDERLREILGDPDQGLELKGDVKDRLKHSLSAMEAGEKSIPLGQVARELGLEWE